MENRGQIDITIISKEEEKFKIKIDFNEFIEAKKRNTEKLFLIDFYFKDKENKKYFKFYNFNTGKERNDFFKVLSKSIKNR